MKTKILNRSDIDIKDTWNLADIFASDDDWKAEFESISSDIKDYENYKGTLANSPEALFGFLKFNDQIKVRLSKLYSYASCMSDVDTANSFYQDLRGKAIGLMSKVNKAGAFCKNEILAISDEKIEQFFKDYKELSEYKRLIYSLRRKKEHILSEREEKLLAAANVLADAPDTIAGIFRDADLSFPDATDKNGNKHPLSQGTFVPLLESEDRVLRQSAYENYYKTLGGFKNTIAATLDAQFKTLKFYADARNYKSTLHASLDSTEVPIKVYRNLIDTVHNNLDKMYRYVNLRKRKLNLKTLCMYDVYTPIVKDFDKQITYAEASDTVLKALAVLGEDYTSVLKTAFNERWIDVYETKGKRSGAYCASNARPHPFVLLNQKDNLESMFTIAHELGHAMHSFLSEKNQPVSTSNYVIFVAEVASTVNEVLLMRYLLKNAKDKNEKAYLLNHFLDQFKGTLFRQTMFAEFELKMGEFVENGTTLTADLLCDEYLKLNKLYFGEDMESDENIALEWARIPHFFYDYYVFQYATGFSAAVKIADRILTEGERAVKEYKAFLSSGCSKEPIELLKIAGVDMSSPEPINTALKLFSDTVKELEDIVLK